MTISYPLTPPSTPGYVASQFRAMTVVGKMRSPFTGKAYTQTHQGQWWEADVALPPMLRSTAEQWIAFLISLKGPEGTFLLGDPDNKSALGTFTGTPIVNGTGQTGVTLNTSGWTSGIVIKAGNYIQLGTGATTRLYKNLQDATATGGSASLDIFPRLRETPSGSQSVVISNPKGLFRLIDNNQARWDANRVSVYGLSFSCEEAF
jgi:hypothetical protein